MRYFDFIKEIKEISTSHILVNEYGEGDIYEYLNNGEHKYPCIFLTVTNLNTTDSGTAINFTLFYTDRLVENQANKTAIQSTGISVIKQILSRYEQLHPEYLLSNVNYTPFTEKFTDMCAGVFCDVVIENQIDTLEDYDNECEEGAFEVKTITLTKNGVYDIVGYDSAIVLVEIDCHEFEELVDELTNTIEQQGVEIDTLNTTIEQKDIIIYEKDEQINSVTTLSITQNGTYTPPTDVLGYNEVVVNIGGGEKVKVSSLKVNNDCIVDGKWDGDSIDTSNVTSMDNMFKNCSSLQSLDVTNFNTSKVTNMGYMFQNCSALQTLDVSGWDTSKVTNMGWMFDYCRSLQSLDVSGWDTSKVTNMSAMFYNCDLLQSLDLSGWDTSKVTNIGNMFNYCYKLTTLIGGRTIDEVISNNIGILNGLNVSVNSIFSSYIDRASLRALINGLADRTGQNSLNLSLSSTLKEKLTEEDIAVATAKNWTIS